MQTTKIIAPEPSILTGDNPFGVLPECDRPQPVLRGVENYSETYYFVVWDPAEETGVLIHAGRMTADVDLWYNQVFAFLPGGELVADRSFSRGKEIDGPAPGNLQLRVVEPLKSWSIRYDGAGELTTRDASGKGPVGAGPAVPMQFDLRFEAVAPAWDLGVACGMDKHLTAEQLSWAGRHWQQALSGTGSLTVQNRSRKIQGVAYRDHSCGVRNLVDFGGDSFVCIMFPQSGRVVQGLESRNRAGEPTMRSFYIAHKGKFELAREGTLPRAIDSGGNPRDGLEVIINSKTEGTLILKGKVLHGLTMTMLEPNINVNGAFHGDPRSIFFNEDIVQFTWPDGEIGYGHMERSLRLPGKA